MALRGTGEEHEMGLVRWEGEGEGRRQRCAMLGVPCVAGTSWTKMKGKVTDSGNGRRVWSGGRASGSDVGGG